MLSAETSQSTWHTITGGWSGLLQGSVGSLIGTLIGVLGAFAVARWTTHHELQRDRQQIKDQAAVGAADRLSSILHEMSAHLQHLDPDRFYGDQAWAGRRFAAWQELSQRLKRQVNEDALILTDDVQVSLADLTHQIDGAYVVTEHLEHAPFFELGSDDKVAQLRTAVEAAIDRLNELRADVYAEPSQPAWHRRPWIPWTITAVAGLLLSGVLVLD